MPPRLVTGRAWHIVFYALNGGAWVRQRKTFGLNRIENKTERRKRAAEIIKSIDAPTESIASTNLIDAIRMAEDIQAKSPKTETRRSYKCVAKLLITHIVEQKKAHYAIGDWTRKDAHAFLDEAVQRGICNTTYNNYRSLAVTLWNVLINRELIEKNPWQGIRQRRRNEKTRRNFSPDEIKVILPEIEKDFWMYVMVQLHYTCLIRRTECYRLRFKHFNLAEGYIELPETVTKNGKRAIVTIPNAFLSFLRGQKFSGYPINYLVFGKNGQPHPSIPAAENTYKLRHRKILLKLKKEGKIADIRGLSLYSWKDTGMTELAKVLSPFQLRDHARHASIDQSLAYYHQEKIILAVRTAF